MILRCELCGTAIPALDRETIMAQGYLCGVEGAERARQGVRP